MISDEKMKPARKCRVSSVLIVCLAIIAQSSCRKNSAAATPVKEVIVLQSTPECENVIVLNLGERNQYSASISSDIPVYNGIEFSGWYQKGKTFIIFGDIAGNEIKLNLHQTPRSKETWIFDGMSEEEALNSGWLLESR